jgi:hypothetical protein
MERTPMPNRDRRFFLRLPVGYFAMTEDEQQAATRAMWACAMTQLGEDPDRFISGRAAQGECHDHQV